MSAQEQEATQEPSEATPETETAAPAEEPTEPQEPNEDTEPVEESEPIEGPDETPPDQSPEGEPQPHMLSEKERKARDNKLDKENELHAGRVGKIMGDEATDLIPCPVCMDGIAGWVFLPEVKKLPDEAIARIRQVIGLPDYTNFQDAPDARKCPDCAGKGKGKTGSDVPGRETKDCKRCNGQGWVPVGVAANGEVPHSVAVPEITGPTVYGAGDPDDRVRALREEGFTVIPPMVVNQQG